MGNIVKYHNDLNNLVFRTFNINELDIFYTIMFKMKDKSEATFTFDEIKKLSIIEGKNRSLKRFYKYLDNVFKTQLQIKEKNENNETEVTDFNLFTTKKINQTNKMVSIKLNSDCIYILNNILKNFTKFELEEFLHLKSEYSKILFRHLKQFENGEEKKVFFKFEDFRILMNIPETYEQYNINQRVLEPVLKELKKNIYPKLEYEKISEKGRKISHIIFFLEGKQYKKQEQEKEKTYSEEVEKLFAMLRTDERIESRKKELDQLLKQHSFEMLKGDIEYCRRTAKTNFWGLFLKSVNEGHYSTAEIEKEKKAEEKKEKEASEEKEIKKTEEEELEKILSNLTKNDINDFDKYYSDNKEKLFKNSTKSIVMRAYFRDKYFQK